MQMQRTVCLFFIFITFMNMALVCHCIGIGIMDIQKKIISLFFALDLGIGVLNAPIFNFNFYGYIFICVNDNWQLTFPLQQHFCELKFPPTLPILSFLSYSLVFLFSSAKLLNLSMLFNEFGLNLDLKFIFVAKIFISI